MELGSNTPIHSNIILKRPLLLSNISDLRKPVKICNIQSDQKAELFSDDPIQNIEDINPVKNCPKGYELKKSNTWILVYHTVFDEDSEFPPSVSECIRIDSNMHVQFQYNGTFFPLPIWFIQGRGAKLTTHFSMLEKFPSYTANEAESHPFPILDELQKQRCRNLKVASLLWRSNKILSATFLHLFTGLQVAPKEIPAPFIIITTKAAQG